MNLPHAMTIAGSDPGGGAGIQGDLKTFCAMNVYGMAVLTALTAQNSHEVRGVHAVPPDFVRLQLRTVLDDIRCDAAKTGMLANADIIRAVAEEWRAHSHTPLVVDPVMVTTSGARLLEPDAIDTLVRDLLPLCTVTTPNSVEAEVLAGFPVRTLSEAHEAAREIHRLGAPAVLITGGHLETGDEMLNVLFDGSQDVVIRSRRVPSHHTHGSGCALAASICAGLAKGMDLRGAVEQACRFVRNAVECASPVGKGPGPVNHLFAMAGADAEPQA
jgi:hydroxymethylpyrimidine/phosphomethylpyrimidine kinase